MRATFIIHSFIPFLSLVLAQSNVYFYITNPIQGSVFVAGALETITWINGIDENATVTLLTGSNTLTMTSAGISFTIQGAQEYYDWTVPTNLSQNATYSLQITYTVNDTMAYSYSSAFTITDTSNQTVNNSSSTTSIATALPTSTVLSNSTSIHSSTAAISTVSSVIPTFTRSSISSSTPTTASATNSLAPSMIASTTPTPSTSTAMINAPTCIVAVVAIMVLSLLV